MREKVLELLKNGARLEELNGKWVVRQMPFIGHMEAGLSVEECKTKEEALQALHAKAKDVTKPLAKMNKAELLEKAKELDIEVNESMKNEQIIGLIKTKEEAKND